MRVVWLVVLAGLAGCAGNEDVSVEPVGAPQWRAGYAFAYDIMGHVDSRYSLRIDGALEDQDAQDITIPPQPALVFEVLNSSHEGAYLAAARMGAAMQYTLHGQGMLGKGPVAVRHHDLAPLPVETSHVERCDPGCRMAMTSMEVRPASMERYLAFPLVADKTWRNQLDLDLDIPGMFILIESRVAGVETVDGPDGPVEAVRIDHELKLPFDSAAAGAFAQASGMGGTFDFALDGGMTTWYAPSLLAVVREHTDIRLRLDADVTAEGHRVELRLTSNLDITTWLSGVDLEPEPELDMAGFLAFFDGVEPVKDPTGASAGAYTLRVTADQARFNVAHGHDGNFTVVAEPALPAGHTVRYSVIDAVGELLDAGEGTSFTARFEEPGLHEVFVQAVGANGVVEAMHSIVVAADFEDTIVLDCEPAIVLVRGACSRAGIPMRSLDGVVAFEARLDDDALVRHGGTLTVRDFVGNAATSDGRPIVWEDVQRLRPGQWTAAWAPDMAVQQEAAITLKLEYGPSAPAPVAGPEGWMAWATGR